MTPPACARALKITTFGASSCSAKSFLPMGKRIITTTHGYQALFLPEHPNAMRNGYIYIHRLKMAQKLGRPLEPTEIIHHIDHNKQNNRISNLKITTKRGHRFEHRRSGKKLQLPDEPNSSITCECGCGEKLLKFDAYGRPRKFQSGHNSSFRHHGRDRVLSFLSTGPKPTYLILKECKCLPSRLTWLKRGGYIRRIRRGVWGK